MEELKEVEIPEAIEHLAKLSQGIPGNIFIKDRECKYVFSSSECDAINRDGKDPDWSMLGKTDLEVQRDKTEAEKYYQDDLEILRTGKSSQMTSVAVLNGIEKILEIVKAPLKNSRGEIIGIIGTVTDITEKEDLNRQIQEVFLKDAVTGLFNRQYVQMWQEKSRPQFPFSIIVADCNFLKFINDNQGHEAGDLLLKKVGSMFLEVVPEHCIPIRDGGDEFLILCNHTDQQQVETLVKKLQAYEKQISTPEMPISVAYGYYTMTEEIYSFSEGKHRADSRMYERKRQMKETYLSNQLQTKTILDNIRFESFIKQLPVVMFFKDTQCKYQYISSFYEGYLHNQGDLKKGIGYTDLELQKDQEQAKQYYQDDLKILKTGQGSNFMTKINFEGKTHTTQVVKEAARDPEGNIIGIVGVVVKLSE